MMHLSDRLGFKKHGSSIATRHTGRLSPSLKLFTASGPNSDLGKEALFWSADAHFQYQNYGPASSQYARFIRAAPEHELIGAAKYALGWSYFKMGDYENATGPLIDFMENYEPPSIALFPLIRIQSSESAMRFMHRENTGMPCSIITIPSVQSPVVITRCSRWPTATIE